MAAFSILAFAVSIVSAIAAIAGLSDETGYAFIQKRAMAVRAGLNASAADEETKLDAIFVINLDDRPERWDFARQQLLKTNVLFHRFSATKLTNCVDEPMTLQGNPAKRMKVMQVEKPEKFCAAVGCLVSHIKLLQHIQKIGKPGGIYLVLEDDVSVSANTSRWLPAVLGRVPQRNWDAIRLDCWDTAAFAKGTAVYRTLGDENNMDDSGKTHFGGTHAILYRYEGIGRVIDHFQSSSSTWNSADAMFWTPHLQNYCVNLNIVNLNLSFESDIQNLR